MRNRFDAQYSIYTLKFDDLKINQKSRDATSKLFIALKELYTNLEYNNQLFSIL